MEKWKIATIAALLLSLVGFGMLQSGTQPPTGIQPTAAPGGAPLPSPYLGKTLPPWTFKTWSTKPVPQASLNGKPALIEIFRTNCSHCNDAAPFMNALQNRYAPRGLKIVAIQSPGDLKTATNPENIWTDVQAWLKSKGTNYPVAFDSDSKYYQGTLKKQFLGDDPARLSYPTLILTDKTGKVDWADTGHDISKAIALAVELEKRFPTSDSVEKNAADLVKWLDQHLPEFEVPGDMAKALADDITQRLKGEE